jgi:hypothetical protein
MLYAKLHHGSCNGVGSLSLGPKIGSAVPISLPLVRILLITVYEIRIYPGPRGAQYWPVFDMSKVLIQSISEPAATSGVTAGM